jgi:hypothetical protein
VSEKNAIEAAVHLLTSDRNLSELALRPSRLLRDFLRERQWPLTVEEAVAPLLLAPLVDYWAHLNLWHPGRLLPLPPDSGEALMANFHFLRIGSCPNGDFVVVDCLRHVGAVLYLSHEELELQEPSNILEVSRLVAPTVAEFLVGMHAEQIPLDYFSP